MFDSHLFRHFYAHFHYFLYDFLYYFSILYNLFHGHYPFYDSLNNPINRGVDIPNHFYLNDFLLINRYFHSSFNLPYALNLNNSIDNPLNNLWYFNYLLDNSRNHNNLLGNLLNLHYFGNFHHLLNNFIHLNPHLFDTLHRTKHLH